MSLPSVLVDIIEDYLFPSFTEPLVKVEKITLPSLDSGEVKKGFEMGMRGDKKELSAMDEYLTNKEIMPKDLILIIGIIMGIATAGHSLELYVMFGEFVEDFHEEAAYQALLHGHVLAGEIVNEYWRLVNMNRIRDNILLYGPVSKAMNMIRGTLPDDNHMVEFLLIALQRGDRKLFNFVNQHASAHIRLKVIRDLTEMSIDENEIFQAINIISLSR